MDTDCIKNLLKKLICIFPMPEKLRSLCLKSIQLILYLVVGVTTTLLNGQIYWICIQTHIFSDCHVALGAHSFTITVNLFATAVAWIIAVLFAFFANKLIVFSSKNMSAGTILWQLLQFVGYRLGSGVIDQSIMLVTVDLWGWNGLLMKLISDFIVTIINFFTSKFLVFRKKPADSPEQK